MFSPSGPVGTTRREAASPALRVPSISGLFRKTGLLDGIRRLVERLTEKTNSFTAILCTSIGTSMLACSQSLAAMLTGQLCEPLVKDKSEFALALEDSVIILAPLIPWSIAGAVPLASLGAPLASLPAACYLYLLPLWRLLRVRKSSSDSVISPTCCG